MYRYLVIVENAGNNYSAYAPDVPGCASVGDTIEETLKNFREALQLHLEGTFADGDPAPYPYSVHSGFVEVAVSAPAQATVAS